MSAPALMIDTQLQIDQLQSPSRQALNQAAGLARPEPWTSSGSSRENDILAAVILARTRRALDQECVSYANDKQECLIATGLETTSGELVYARYARHRFSNSFACIGFHAEGERVLGKFASLPNPAGFLTESGRFRSDWPWQVHGRHALDMGRRERLPDSLRSLPEYTLGILIHEALHREERLVKCAPHRVAAQWYKDAVGFVVPCCLTHPNRADLAAVLELSNSYYRVPTLLPIGWAYIGARIVGPPPEWLVP